MYALTHTKMHTCKDLERVRRVVVSSSDVAYSFLETCMIIQDVHKKMETLRNWRIEFVLATLKERLLESLIVLLPFIYIL
jgi:predicted PP-loop superfamily ATPase